MNAIEFLRNVTPAVKRSRLAPYWEEVVNLRNNNCTLGQVCCFLQKNGVQISIAGLSKYIQRRNFLVQGDRTKAQPISNELTAVTQQSDQRTSQGLVATPPLGGGYIDTEGSGAGETGLSPKQRRERRADQFIKSENTVLNKLTKKQVQ